MSDDLTDNNARLKAPADVHRTVLESDAKKMRSALIAWGDWLAVRGGTDEESEALDVALGLMPSWALEAVLNPPEPRVAPAKGTIRNLRGDDLLSALELWANLGHRAEGHWLTVSVSYTDEGAPCASISWETGTGWPSTFLGGILGDLLDKLEVESE